MEMKQKIKWKDSMDILWEEHVNVIKSLYDTLRLLKLFKKYTTFNLRKTAETLILSKIDYGSVAYQNVPKFLIKRLQKVDLRWICTESSRKRM